AVGHAEHVRRHMREDLAASPQNELGVIGEVPREAVHADAIAQRSLSENEVPRRLGIEIDHRRGDHAEGVPRNSSLEERQDVARQKLSLTAKWIFSRGDLFFLEIDRGKNLHRQDKERARELLQQSERRALDGGEVAERLQVDGASLFV